MPEHGGGEGNGPGHLVKPDEVKAPQVQANEIAGAGSVGVAGQRFRFTATGLWAGSFVTFALTLAIARMAPFPQKGDMMMLLGVALGGMMGTAVMHGRLADNRAELGRVRAELDRKATEYSKLLSKVLKKPRSSRGKRKERE